MTLLPWREHPEAREEQRAAVHWYEDREPGLGSRLADELDEAVDFVREWPETASRYRGRKRIPVIRRKSTDVFPYGIIYFVRDGELIVVAYAHEKRRPGYWRRRLRDL